MYFNTYTLRTHKDYDNLGVAVGVDTDGRIVIREGNISSPGAATGGRLTPAQALAFADAITAAVSKAPELVAAYNEGIEAEAYVKDARKAAIENILKGTH